jgi:rhodanese-related sulfurtransferase
MKTIEREELKAKIDRGDNFKLVMTMNKWAFEASHIPGSLNIYDPDEAFRLLSPDDEIVVYCTNPTCIASIHAYHAFVAVGFKNTRRYSGGLEDWKNAGYPLEGTAVE